MIPFLDARAINNEIADELHAAQDRVVRSGTYLLGGELVAFEHELSLSQGVAHAVGVGSGLDALTLTLMALGVGRGDEVIVPAHTFIATWMAVTLVQATVVPVDVDLDDCNINPDLVEAAITPRTVAVIPVHLYGRPAQMQAIREIAIRRGLAIVADGAQSIGASVNGTPVASLADATTLSFYPAKNLGALGDGGAVLTNDAELARRVRRLRNYGSSDKYVHVEVGLNSRLDELQSAFLRAKLPHIERWNKRRAEIATAYLSELSECDLVMPPCENVPDSAWHLFVVRTEERQRLQAELRQRGVQTLIHYPVPPHRQGAYAEFAKLSFPVAEQLAEEVLSLPVSPVMDQTQLTHVIEAVRTVAAES